MLLCPQIDRYLKDKTLTRRALPSKAQLMSTAVCRPSKTKPARLADLEREETSLLWRGPRRNELVRSIEKRKSKNKEGGGEKRNKRGHKSRSVKRFRLAGDNSVSETISFL